MSTYIFGKPRGRAATPIRPGIIIKKVLMGEVPLRTGEIVNEASINDIHNAYKNLVIQENQRRTKDKKLRGMTDRSFHTLFKFAQLLKLVELVRYESMLFPPSGGSLYSIRVTSTRIHVIRSQRKIFKISDVGREDEVSWTNLCRAWIENWPAPQKMPEVVMQEDVEEEIKEEEEVIIPTPKPPSSFSPLKWSRRPNMKNFKTLYTHLQTLFQLGLFFPGVEPEVDRLSMQMGDWIIEVEDNLMDAKASNNKDQIEMLAKWLNALTLTSEALGDRDIQKAIDKLHAIID